MKKYLPFLVRVKVYIDRARAYYAYAQLIALVSIFLKVFGVPINWRYLLVGTPALIVLSALIGWLDTQFGFFQEEAKRHSDLNPVYRDMLDRLERIEQQTLKQALAHDMHCLLRQHASVRVDPEDVRQNGKEMIRDAPALTERQSEQWGAKPPNLTQEAWDSWPGQMKERLVVVIDAPPCPLHGRAYRLDCMECQAIRNRSIEKK